MLHRRIMFTLINANAEQQRESWRSRKIAFVQRLEWL
jgi:hypothetical protein